jgi:hypothetical protein
MCKPSLLIILMTLFPLISQADTLRMSFDSGLAGEKIVSSSCLKYGEPVFTSDAGMTYYSDKESVGPGMSAEINVPKGLTGFGNIGGIVNFPKCFNSNGRIYKGQEIWISVKLKFPLGFEFNVNGRNKFLRLRTFHGDGNSKVSEGHNDLYINAPPGSSPGKDQPFHYIFEGAQEWYAMGNPEDFFDIGTWNTVEYYLKLDNIKGTDGGESTVRVWIDGKLIGESFDRVSLQRSDSYIESLYFFTYWDNDGAIKDQKFWADDLVITTDMPGDRDSSGNPMIGVGDAKKAKPINDLIVK